MRKFYGVRFLGGNRTCTTGTPHEITGNMSIACDVQIFRSRAERDAWLKKQELSAPTGANGGERIAAKKIEVRKYKLGNSMEAFEEELGMIEMLRYDN